MHLLHLDCNEARARFDWIQEFAMPWNTIGFNISAASRLQFVDAIAKGFGPAIMGDLGSYKESDVLNLVEINVVQPRSMQQGSVALKSPKVFGRSRSNGTRSPRRISFNPSIDSVFIQKPKPKTPPKHLPDSNTNLTSVFGGEQQRSMDYEALVTAASATPPAATILEQLASQSQLGRSEEIDELAKLTHSQMLRIEELEQQAKLTHSQFSRIEQLLERMIDVVRK